MLLTRLIDRKSLAAVVELVGWAGLSPDFGCFWPNPVIFANGPQKRDIY